MNVIDKSRRQFVQLLAATPFSGQALKAAAMERSKSGIFHGGFAAGELGPGGRGANYAERLANLVTPQNISKQIRNRRERRSLGGISPDVAALHSVSLVVAHRMNDRLAVAHELSQEKNYLEKILSGESLL